MPGIKKINIKILKILEQNLLLPIITIFLTKKKIILIITIIVYCNNCKTKAIIKCNYCKNIYNFKNYNSCKNYDNFKNYNNCQNYNCKNYNN